MSWTDERSMLSSYLVLDGQTIGKYGGFVCDDCSRSIGWKWQYTGQDIYFMIKQNEHGKWFHLPWDPLTSNCKDMCSECIGEHEADYPIEVGTRTLLDHYRWSTDRWMIERCFN